MGSSWLLGGNGLGLDGSEGAAGAPVGTPRREGLLLGGGNLQGFLKETSQVLPDPSIWAIGLKHSTPDPSEVERGPFVQDTALEGIWGPQRL